jgi:hypothetical protein
MNSVIVANNINLAIAFPESLPEVTQQLAEESVVLLSTTTRIESFRLSALSSQ